MCLLQCKSQHDNANMFTAEAITLATLGHSFWIMMLLSSLSCLWTRYEDTFFFTKFHILLHQKSFYFWKMGNTNKRCYTLKYTFMTQVFNCDCIVYALWESVYLLYRQPSKKKNTQLWRSNFRKQYLWIKQKIFCRTYIYLSYSLRNAMALQK